jgi:hypothetical protein
VRAERAPCNDRLEMPRPVRSPAVRAAPVVAFGHVLRACGDESGRTGAHARRGAGSIPLSPGCAGPSSEPRRNRGRAALRAGGCSPKRGSPGPSSPAAQSRRSPSVVSPEGAASPSHRTSPRSSDGTNAESSRALRGSPPRPAWSGRGPDPRRHGPWHSDLCPVDLEPEWRSDDRANGCVNRPWLELAVHLVLGANGECQQVPIPREPVPQLGADTRKASLVAQQPMVGAKCAGRLRQTESDDLR